MNGIQMAQSKLIFADFSYLLLFAVLFFSLESCTQLKKDTGRVAEILELDSILLKDARLYHYPTTHDVIEFFKFEMSDPDFLSFTNQVEFRNSIDFTQCDVHKDVIEPLKNIVPRKAIWDIKKDQNIKTRIINSEFGVSTLLLQKRDGKYYGFFADSGFIPEPCMPACCGICIDIGPLADPPPGGC